MLLSVLEQRAELQTSARKMHESVEDTSIQKPRQPQILSLADIITDLIVGKDLQKNNSKDVRLELVSDDRDAQALSDSVSILRVALVEDPDLSLLKLAEMSLRASSRF